MADKNLLKQQIGTSKSDTELGIHRSPETIASPKEVIIQAIYLSRQDVVKRRRKDLNIGQLYLPIGQTLELDKLENFSSYKKFEESVRSAFKRLNLLY